MPVIQRSDGTQFVVRCYRETLSLTNTALFKQHAFLISEMHGYFAKFLPGRSSKNIESVFSTDAGFLLAETIWFHFGKPPSMIFCEKLDHDQYLMVIARDKLIYSEGNLPATELQEELASASINVNDAPIYLFGEIPGFIVPKNPITDPPLLKFNPKNITYLERSIFNALEPLPTLELVPIQQAISDLQLSKASRRNVLGLLTLCFVFIISIVMYYLMSQPQPMQPMDPLQEFRTMLTSPSPTTMLSQTTKTILLLNSIPGWQVNRISIKGNFVSAAANSYGGSAQTLVDWSALNQANVKFTNAAANININLPSLPLRVPPTSPLPLQQVFAKIIDACITLSLKKSVEIGTITSKGAYSSSFISIQLKDVSMGGLLLFGSFLNTLPITVDSLNLDTSSALINGNINITAYGL